MTEFDSVIMCSLKDLQDPMPSSPINSILLYHTLYLSEFLVVLPFMSFMTFREALPSCLPRGLLPLISATIACLMIYPSTPPPPIRVLSIQAFYFLYKRRCLVFCKAFVVYYCVCFHVAPFPGYIKNYTFLFQSNLDSNGFPSG